MGRAIMAVLLGASAAALSVAAAWGADGPSTSVQTPQRSAAATFTNPLYPGQDPSIVWHEGFYYLCQSGPGNRIVVWKSRTLAERGERSVVWSAPRSGWNRAQIWAPELHRIRGKWYIYYAASGGQNESHRMGVLEGSADDPQGPFVDRGMLYTGDDIEGGQENRWAIDGHVFENKGELYFTWSGWEDHRDVQYLYIAKMSDPATISTNRVKLCANDTHLWERVGEDRRQRGLHEAPVTLVRNGKVFLIYSASGSWQATYKLGMLQADVNTDLLDPKSWRKMHLPVFEPTEEVFGVGHCCFTTSPDGKEDWIAYHAKKVRREGWDRQVHVQKFSWTEDGLPDFGRPIRAGIPIPVPSGEDAPLPITPQLHGAAMPHGVAASPD